MSRNRRHIRKTAAWQPGAERAGKTISRMERGKRKAYRQQIGELTRMQKKMHISKATRGQADQRSRPTKRTSRSSRKKTQHHASEKEKKQKPNTKINSRATKKKNRTTARKNRSASRVIKSSYVNSRPTKQ